MDELAILCENVSKSYSSNLTKTSYEAIKNLNLVVKSGEVHGFLGHNGAGKTTTIKMIIKLIMPTSGVIKVFGQDISTLNYLQNVSYVAENVNFYSFLTPYEIANYYVNLNPSINISSNELNNKIDYVLSETGILKWKNTIVEKFSKGMKQRLALALCLLKEPNLLILDEPGSGLDPEGIAMLLNIIKKFKDNGKTVFFSSHHISEVEKVCDKISIIKYGELVKTLDVKECLKNKISIEEEYLKVMKINNKEGN